MADPGPPPVEHPSPSENSQGETTSSAAGEDLNADNPQGTDPANSDRATESETSRSSPPDRPVDESFSVGVGVDPLYYGLNPHMQSNQQAVVDDIASLVLPSAFVNGELNTDLLEAAYELPVAPPRQRVRYTISPQAQWSDGTPITGEDFVYLWKQMTSTPGVISPAGYFAIEDIAISDAGRTVDVTFSQPVEDWQSLFRYLLPTQLINEPFEQIQDLPAAGGRYQVHNIDSARGVITLHRNDRFWGHDPAHIDVIELHEIRNHTQGLDLMRSGQVSFLDLTPQETTFAAYETMADTQVFRFNTPRQLEITASHKSPIFAFGVARQQFFNLIDIESTAILAAGRRTDVRVAENEIANGETSDKFLRQRADAERPVRIAADPSNPLALATAAVIVDQLVARDIPAEVLARDFASTSAQLIPDGEVDAVVGWDYTTETPLRVADDFLCSSRDGLVEESTWITGCVPGTAGYVDDLLSGALSVESASQIAAEVNQKHHVRLPISNERRIRVLGPGIVGPAEDLSQWPAGLKTAAQWQLPD